MGRLGAFHLGSYLDILGLCSCFVLQKRVENYADICLFHSLSYFIIISARGLSIYEAQDIWDNPDCVFVRAHVP